MSRKRVQRTHRGPGGIKLMLDSKEIDHDDPGNGTPALVHSPDGKLVSTFWCVQETGWIEDTFELSAKQREWIEEMAEEVHYFVEIH